MDKKVSILKNDLVNMVSENTNQNKNVVKSVLDGIEGVVIDMLSTANRSRDISIKIFDGLYLTSVFKEGGEYNGNLKNITETKDRIVTKAKLTTTFKQKIRDISI